MADRYRLRPGSPDVHGRPLDRPDGTRTPLFDGDPARDQVQQGGLGDCGVITKRPDQPGFASSGDAGVAWPSIREKALAGVDRTWTNDRRTDWEKRWPRQCEHGDRLPHGLIAAHAYEVGRPSPFMRLILPDCPVLAPSRELTSVTRQWHRPLGYLTPAHPRLSGHLLQHVVTFRDQLASQSGRRQSH
jgi:hypothetical protein